MENTQFDDIMAAIAELSAKIDRIIPQPQGTEQKQPQWRYFRRSNGYLYKLSDDDSSNLHSDDNGETWYPTCYFLREFLDPDYWTDEGVPVEYFPETENH